MKKFLAVNDSHFGPGKHSVSRKENPMRTRRIVFVLHVAALSAVSLGSSGDLVAQAPADMIYPPHSVVEGRTIGEWMVKREQWRSETPPPINPNNNPSVECSSNQNQPVFFLPSDESERVCAVPEGVPLYVSLGAAWYGFRQPSDRCWRSVVNLRELVDSVTHLELEIDGEALSPETLFEHRERSEECFELNIPDPSPGGVPPGTLFDVGTEGYVVVVRPLGPGRHVIRTRFIASPPGQPRIDFERIRTLHVEGPAFLRGDCNDDGDVNLADAQCTLNWLFAGPPKPGCLAALNTNGDEDVNIGDPVFLLNFLFAGGPAPVAPFPDCGPGVLPADTALGCVNPPACQ